MSSNIEKVKKTFEAMSKDLDVAAVSTHWADDYKAQILPESLGLKEMNKEEHLAQATKLVGNIKEYSKVPPLSILLEHLIKISHEMSSSNLWKYLRVEIRSLGTCVFPLIFSLTSVF
jgi:hypothetical protein